MLSIMLSKEREFGLVPIPDRLHDRSTNNHFIKLHNVLDSLMNLKKDILLPPNLAGIRREEFDLSSSEEEEKSEAAETTMTGGQEVSCLSRWFFPNYTKVISWTDERSKLRSINKKLAESVASQ
eukprot:291375-Hanusia_phi.AAC.1